MLKIILFAIIGAILFFQGKWIYEVFVSGDRKPLSPAWDLVFRALITTVVVAALLGLFPVDGSSEVLSPDQYDYVKTEEIVFFVYEDLHDRSNKSFIYNNAENPDKIEVEKISLHNMGGGTITSVLSVEKDKE